MQQIFVIIAAVIISCLIITLVILWTSCQRDNGRMDPQEEEELYNKLNNKEKAKNV